MLVLLLLSVCLSLTFPVKSAPVVKITYPPCGHERVSVTTTTTTKTNFTKSYTSKTLIPTEIVDEKSAEFDDTSPTVAVSTPCEVIIVSSTTRLTTKPNTEQKITKLTTSLLPTKPTKTRKRTTTATAHLTPKLTTSKPPILTTSTTSTTAKNITSTQEATSFSPESSNGISLLGLWVTLAVLVVGCILIYAAYVVYVKLHSGSYITHERYISSSMVSLLSTNDKCQ